MLLLALALAGCKSEKDDKEFGDVPQSEGPATYANFYCDVLAACDCNFPVSGDACVSAATSQFQSAFDEAAAAGLTYHGECLGDYLEYIDGLGCATITELVADPDFAEFDIYGCKVFSGTAAEGEACTAYYEVFGDSCQQGLACFGDTCTTVSTTPPPTKQIGETCDPQSEVCEDGLCTTVDGTTFTCVALPVEGESCMQTGVCAEPSWCDYTDYLCKAAVGEGEACDSGGPNCQANLFCNDETMVCEPLKTEGGSCEDDEQCVEGLVCDEPPADDGSGDVCQPEGPLVCVGF